MLITLKFLSFCAKTFSCSWRASDAPHWTSSSSSLNSNQTPPKQLTSSPILTSAPGLWRHSFLSPDVSGVWDAGRARPGESAERATEETRESTCSPSHPGAGGHLWGLQGDRGAQRHRAVPGGARLLRRSGGGHCCSLRGPCGPSGCQQQQGCSSCCSRAVSTWGSVLPRWIIKSWATNISDIMQWNIFCSSFFGMLVSDHQTNVNIRQRYLK